MADQKYFAKIKINPGTHLNAIVDESFIAPNTEVAMTRVHKWMSVLGINYSGPSGNTKVELSSLQIEGQESAVEYNPFCIEVTPMEKLFFMEAADSVEKELLQYGFKPENSGSGNFISSYR